MTTTQARGTIKRYTVAPHIDADLCDRCWLAPVNATSDLTSDQHEDLVAGIDADPHVRTWLVLSHDEYVRIHPHRDTTNQ